MILIQTATVFQAARRGLGRWVLMLTILLCLFFGFGASALPPDRTITQYGCRTWTAENGFPAPAATSIAQTRDGFIWIGTQKGLVRFDGMNFVLLAPAQNPLFQHQAISALSASEDGSLWFGILNGGFGIYSANTGFSTLTNQPWVKPEMKVSTLLQARDGSHWVGAAAGVNRWFSELQEVHSFDVKAPECLSIFEDSRNRVWLSLLSQGVFYFDGARIVPFPDLAYTNNNVLVFGITEDQRGQFWFATQYGLRVYDSGLRSNQAPNINSKSSCVLTDREGTVWIGSDGNGLFCWRDGQLSNLKRSNGLADDRITALREDRNGNLWVGTRGGLSMLSDVKFPLYSPEGTNQNTAFHSVSAAAEGGLWAGANSGLFRFDGKQFRYFGIDAGLEDGWLKQVFEANDGDLYIANGAQDVEILRDGKVVARHKCSTWPCGFAQDSESVVIGVGEQLFRIGPSGLSPYQFTNQTSPTGWIRSLNSTREGTILEATANGLYLVKHGSYERFGQENGLPGNDVIWACEDVDGVIWAGLSDGLSRIHKGRVDSWTRENGLYDDFIRAIVPDDRGWLWLQSESGIFRVRRDSLFLNGQKAHKIKCEVFDTMDAVKTSDTADVEYSVCKTRDGRIWFPSPQGLIEVDSARIVARAEIPLAHIATVRANGETYEHANRIVVQPGRGELEVQYTAPEFVAPQKLQFRYKLDGYESNWEPATQRRSAFYTNLRPGKYQFLVQAISPDGLSFGRTDSFSVELRPFFHQTRWFYALCAGIALAALAGTYGGRVSYLKRKQLAMQADHDRLETEVQNRTAELKERTVLLEKEIEARSQMQAEIERVHRRLLEASRLAGQAEVATGVLHNVGNVLNSVNVSANLLVEQTRQSRVAAVGRVAELVNAHSGDLAAFFSHDPKGSQLPPYLTALSEHLKREQKIALEELEALRKNIDHIKEIVAMQQSYGKVAGVTTKENVAELVEDALRMNQAALERHRVSVVRELDELLPPITVDRHKVMQVLLNLIGNAKYACEDSAQTEKKMKIRVTNGEQRIRISVTDNGVGIPRENLTRIFNHGFTTRKHGHGFGLHTCALAVKEMGGELRAASDGPGSGATFTLELPLQPPSK